MNREHSIRWYRFPAAVVITVGKSMTFRHIYSCSPSGSTDPSGPLPSQPFQAARQKREINPTRYKERPYRYRNWVREIKRGTNTTGMPVRMCLYPRSFLRIHRPARNRITARKVIPNSTGKPHSVQPAGPSPAAAVITAGPSPAVAAATVVTRLSPAAAAITAGPSPAAAAATVVTRLSPAAAAITAGPSPAAAAATVVTRLSPAAAVFPAPAPASAKTLPNSCPLEVQCSLKKRPPRVPRMVAAAGGNITTFFLLLMLASHV
jgi:hypothetical protein